MKQRILCIFGTRPEAIKMAPVVQALQARPDRFEVFICVTGQHRQMLDQVLGLFRITPDFDLALMAPGQDLYDITSRALIGLRPVLKALKPDRVLVHGDTTTTLAASLAAYYEKIPVGHVEAGLRTGNPLSPWPEEMNRRVAGAIADLHFAPTPRARTNLLNENVHPDRIFITGNTAIDALLSIVSLIRKDSKIGDELEKSFGYLDPSKRLVLVTGHRRESFGAGFENICHALRDIVEGNPGCEIIYPVHLNPNVQEPVRRILGTGSGTGSFGRIHLIAPLDYLPFVYLMTRAHLILTDSGGIQEEAPSLRKPVLVMRRTTERPEAIAAGCAKLVGTDRGQIVTEANKLLNDPTIHETMASVENPYGNGDAADQIATILETFTYSSLNVHSLFSVKPVEDSSHKSVPA